ncbi:MAG: GumC family protein [Sulfuriferula sp.]
MVQAKNNPVGQADIRQPIYAEEDEINLMDLLLVIAKHNRFILKLTIGVAVLAAIYVLLQPNIYTGKTVILPPQQQSSSSASLLLGQLGGMAGMAGGALGLKNPSDLYVGLLKSDTVADELIQKFHLQSLYDVKTLTDARTKLKSVSSIAASKDGFITIEFSSKDPKLAAAIANAYVGSLSRLSQTFAISEAAQRRLFFEQQLKITSDNLGLAELALKHTQEKTGLIQIDKQGSAMINAVANLRAQVTTQEVLLATMRSYATERNPDYIKAEQTLLSLKAQLADVERGSMAGNGDVLVPTNKIPQAGLEVMRKMRDEKYQETLYELLSKQYEMAKLDEAKEAAIIQVVDKAPVPEKKSKPKRVLIVFLSTILGLFVGIVWAFFKEASESAQQNPEQAERLKLFRKYLRG